MSEQKGVIGDWRTKESDSVVDIDQGRHERALLHVLDGTIEQLLGVLKVLRGLLELRGRLQNLSQSRRVYAGARRRRRRGVGGRRRGRCGVTGVLELAALGNEPCDDDMELEGVEVASSAISSSSSPSERSAHETVTFESTSVPRLASSAPTLADSSSDLEMTDEHEVMVSWRREATSVRGSGSRGLWVDVRGCSAARLRCCAIASPRAVKGERGMALLAT